MVVQQTQSDLDKALKALKMADEANNVEDAKRLAVIVKKLANEKTQTVEDDMSSKSNLMGYVNKGLATTLGAPVDLVTSGLGLVGVDIDEPVGGTKSIEGGLRKIGIDIPEKEPETLSEQMAGGVGEVLGGLLPAGHVSKLLSRGSGLTGSIAKSIMDSLSKHPILSTISEVGGGAGVGIGRKIGEEHPSTKPYAEMVGGVAGSIAPSMVVRAPSRLAYEAGKGVARKATLPFTEKGSKYRTGEFLKKQVLSPEQTAEDLTKETISGMPPAIATGEKRLVALYKELASKDPIKEADAIDKITKSMVKLADEFKKLGKDSPVPLKELIQKRVSALEISMDKRILETMGKAQDSLDALPVAQRKSKESIVVKDSLEDLMKEERNNVRDIWKLVPKEIEIEPTNTKLAYQTLFDDSSQAQLEDFPKILKKSFIFDEETEIPVTVKEMQGLRSKLLEVERNARAATNPKRNLNTARICGEISDAILKDIDDMATGSGDDTLKNALKATYNFKSKFEKGIVGKVLGLDRTGTPTIDPEITLDIAIARNPEQAAVNINKITITPEAKQATKRYIARSFTDYALDAKTGTIVPYRADKWARNNEAILDQFPDLKNQILDTSKSQKLADRTKILMDKRKAKLKNPNISVASNFLKSDIEKEIPSILKSKKPVFAANQLVKMASKDQSGKSLDGLRAGFLDHILEHSSTGNYNEVGERCISGNAMHNFLTKNKATLSQVFTKEQLSRIDKITNEFSKIEIFMSDKTKTPKFKTDDKISNALVFISRWLGAESGARLSSSHQIQVPGYFAERYKSIMSKLNIDKADRLLSDAILSDDPTLFKTLLLPIDKPNSKITLDNLKLIDQRLNVWLLGSGNRVLQDIEEENKVK